PLNTPWGVNAATTLRLETGHEDIQTAEGDRRTGHVSVFATVHRPPLETLKQNLIELVVSGLPAIARDALAAIISVPIAAAATHIDALTNESGRTVFTGAERP